MGGKLLSDLMEEPKTISSRDDLPSNLTELLFALDISDKSAAIWWKGREISRAEVFNSVRLIANFFTSRNVIRGSRIIILLPDSPTFVSFFLGTILADLIPIPVSIKMSPNELDDIVKDSEADQLVTTKEVKEAVVVQTERAKNISILLTSLDWKEDLIPTESSTATSLVNKEEYCVPRCAFWQYTSGSTGQPKAVMHSHHSAFFSCDSYARAVLGTTSQDRIFSVAKMSFGYGLGNSLFFPFLIGATSIITDEWFTPEIISQVLMESRASVFFGVPSVYAKLLSAVKEGLKLDLGNVRICVSAGEALPQALQRAWQRQFGHPIVDGLGTTELLHICISNKPDEVVMGSLGCPVPNCKARIVNQNSEEVPVGEQGLLEILSPSRMIGYWKHQNRSETILQEKWIRTGDICTYDKHGRFWFRGRINKVFKVKGLWVSPIEVENVLMEHEMVSDALVSKEIDDNGLVFVTAMIVPRICPTEKDLAEELREFVREKLSPHKRPSDFLFVRELPTTATEKKRRGTEFRGRLGGGVSLII